MSLSPRSRLSRDSPRSPRVETTTVQAPSAAPAHQGPSMAQAHPAPVATAASREPISPSQDFLGETEGARG